MSDEELIERLRDAPADGLGTENLCIAAADRIEALVKERDILIDRHERNLIVGAETRARAERLEAALRETTQVLRQCTFQYIRVEGQYLDREEVVSRADAALKGADHE